LIRTAQFLNVLNLKNARLTWRILDQTVAGEGSEQVNSPDLRLEIGVVGIQVFAQAFEFVLNFW
jgi:hypothetical protein|tara:strand:- start:342 stop:533 length:192 start_codon:yes stop_codon:yes gene_type:complete